MFLHAGVCDRRMWLDQLDALSNDRLAVAYDRRGFGETTSPDEPFSHVGDLLGVMDALAIGEALEWLDGPAGPEGRVGGEARELFLDMNAIALAHPALDQEIAAANAMPSLAAIQQRTLVACGALDLPWEIDLCRRLAALVPDAETHVFPAAAHLPSMEMPGAVNELLRDFLH